MDPRPQDAGLHQVPTEGDTLEGFHKEILGKCVLVFPLLVKNAFCALHHYFFEQNHVDYFIPKVTKESKLNPNKSEDGTWNNDKDAGDSCHVKKYMAQWHWV